MTTPFPFGAYPNGPDYPTHAQQFADITRLMGAPPQWQDVYVHEQQPLSNWISNAEWSSGVWAGSASKDTIPSIGFPLYSCAPGEPLHDDQMTAFASGQHDEIVRGCLRAYARYSKRHVWRIGWEMNLQSLPWFAGDRAESWQRWISAFQRVATVLRDEARQQGVTIETMWNPGATSWSNAGRADQTLWVGPEHCDIIGIDLYNEIWAQGGDNPFDWTTGKPVPKTEWILNPENRRHHWMYAGANEWDHHGDNPGNQSFSLAMAIDLAKQHNKSLSLAETGVLNASPPLGVPDDAEFPSFLASALASSGVAVHSVVIWDAGDVHNPSADANWSNADTRLPNVQRAWVANFGSTSVEPLPPEEPRTLTITGTFTATIDLPPSARWPHTVSKT